MVEVKNTEMVRCWKFFSIIIYIFCAFGSHEAIRT